MISTYLKKHILACGLGFALCYSSIGQAQESINCDTDSFETVQKDILNAKKKIYLFGTMIMSGFM